jgi:hypothetical protein
VFSATRRLSVFATLLHGIYIYLHACVHTCQQDDDFKFVVPWWDVNVKIHIARELECARVRVRSTQRQ